jgi:hypothetical protein
MINFTKIFAFLLLVLVACKNEKPQPTTVTNEVIETEDNSGPEIPGVPQEVMVKLLNECTFVDYIFHVLPFSLSQEEDPSIDQNINFIDINKPLKRIPARCKKADGRKFFLIKGKSAYDVDVYITNNCKFYVFVDKNNKPIYANEMTQAGINFYENIIKQASGMSQQQ